VRITDAERNLNGMIMKYKVINIKKDWTVNDRLEKSVAEMLAKDLNGKYCVPFGSAPNWKVIEDN
jgi:ATP-dependent protease HslVU (ClpYQ) peptidase subunit